ncbi:MAG: NYN domain-containing protein [Patescibacteria group bacterium]|nr:NYN domain-containing protein [Patescibacteria group bacterium]
MDKKAKKILEKYKNKRAGVFIDDANMFHTQRELKRTIDWRNFKHFLENNFEVEFIKYYRGAYPKSEKIPSKIRENNLRYAQILKNLEFEVIHRNLKKIYINKKKTKFIYKCDFDAEIGFDVGACLTKVDIVIIISGDSDFVCLAKKLQKQNKNFLMLCFEYKAPWEVRKIHHIFLETIENILIPK